jgi:hypothetical protein
MKVIVKLLFIAMSTLLLNSSCQKSDIEPMQWDDEGLITLGKKLENPYTVQNMRQAYSNLKSTKLSVPDYEISTTHYYVRFLPDKENELTINALDSLVFLSEMPLDYEFDGDGYYFHDPSLPYEGPTWLYGVIEKNDEIPDIPYQILAELFLTPTSENLQKNFDDKWVEFFDELEHEALRITDNLENDDEVKSSKNDSWTPKGRITAWDDIANDYIGIEHVRVRVRRWFRTLNAITDAEGYYQCTESFKRPAKYKIVWKRHNFSIVTNNTRINDIDDMYSNDISMSPRPPEAESTLAQIVVYSIAATGCKRMQYIGPKKIGDWNVRIPKGTPYHLHAITFKAAAFYYYGDIGGLSRPPLNDDIGTQLKINVNFETDKSFSRHAAHKPRARSFLDPAWISINDNRIYTDELFGMVIRQLAHASLFFKNKSAYNNGDDELIYSWPMGVDYYLTKKSYPRYKLAYSRGDNAGIVEDLMDDFSIKYCDFQDFYQNFIPVEYFDSVSGYTITQIESALSGAKTVDDWKNNLKNMFNNETENNLDEAFDFWFNND